MSVKTKTKQRAKLLEEPPAASLAAPETPEARIKRITKAMYQPGASKDVRKEFRDLLEEKPQIARLHGTLASMARESGLERFENAPVLEESIKFQLKQMRKDLAGEHASPLEVLLVDAVCFTYQDYFAFALIYGQRTGKSFNMRDMTQWERILASKEARYLRAVEQLARVRRLLNLSAPQVNINLPGGQQVNVQGNPSGS